MEAKSQPAFKTIPISNSRRARTRGVVALQHHPYSAQQSFTREDILWAIGIWSVILTLTPAIAVYFLMVV